MAQKDGPRRTGRKRSEDGHLTPAQEKFCNGVVSGLTQAQAFINAYPAAKAWSDQSVSRRAWELTTNAGVAERIKQLTQQAREIAAQKAAVSKARIMAEQAVIAFADIRDALDHEGNPLPFHQWPEHLRRAVQSVEFVYLRRGEDEDPRTGQVVARMVAYPSKVRFAPKINALDQLARILGMYEADNRQKGGQTGLEQLPAESRDAIIGRLREIVGSNRSLLAGGTESGGSGGVTH